MNGKEARLRRLSRHIEGRFLIVPLDHSVSDGPISSNGEFQPLVRGITSSGADAIVVHKGRIRQLPAQAFLNASVIVQLSASTRYARDPNEKVLVCSVEDAVMRGADGITVHVNVGSNSEAGSARGPGRNRRGLRKTRHAVARHDVRARAGSRGRASIASGSARGKLGCRSRGRYREAHTAGAGGRCALDRIALPAASGGVRRGQDRGGRIFFATPKQ